MIKKGRVLLLSILLISHQIFASNVTPQAIGIKEAISKALDNNQQLKMYSKEVDVAKAKVIQARSAYMPKLLLTAGVARLSEPPKEVQLANKIVDLNNALDGAYDMLKLDLGTQAQYYGGLAAKDAATYGKTAQMFKSAYDSASSIAGKMSQKDKYDEGLNYIGVKLSFQQPIYTGNKITATNNIASENEKLASLSFSLSRSAIIFDTKKAFYTVLTAQRFVDTAAEAVASIEKHVKEADSYYKAGLVPKLDVIRAEAKLAEYTQKLIAAKNGLALAKTAFNFTIGGGLQDDYLFTDELAYSPPAFNLDSLKGEALKNRIELKQLDTKLSMAKENIEIAKSGGRPLVALTGQIEQKDTKIKWDPEWSITLGATMNIFDGFLVSGQIKEAEEVYTQAARGRDLLVRAIELDVTQSYLNLMNALESIEAAKKNITTAEETSKMADANYKAGLGTSLDKIDSEVNLIQAKNTYTQALAQYSIAWAQLEKSLGRSEQ